MLVTLTVVNVGEKGGKDKGGKRGRERESILRDGKNGSDIAEPWLGYTHIISMLAVMPVIKR